MNELQCVHRPLALGSLRLFGASKPSTGTQSPFAKHKSFPKHRTFSFVVNVMQTHISSRLSLSIECAETFRTFDTELISIIIVKRMFLQPMKGALSAADLSLCGCAHWRMASPADPHASSALFAGTFQISQTKIHFYLKRLYSIHLFAALSFHSNAKY